MTDSRALALNILRHHYRISYFSLRAALEHTLPRGEAERLILTLIAEGEAERDDNNYIFIPKEVHA